MPGNQWLHNVLQGPPAQPWSIFSGFLKAGRNVHSYNAADGVTWSYLKKANWMWSEIQFSQAGGDWKVIGPRSLNASSMVS